MSMVQKTKNICKCTNAESNLERKNRANIYLFFLQIWTTFLKQINISGIQKILNLYVLTFVEYFSYFVLILTSEDENDTTTSCDGDSYTSLGD